MNHRGMAKLSRRQCRSAVNLAFEHNGTANACTHGQTEHGFCVLACAKMQFTQGHCAHIIVQINRESKAFLQRAAQIYILPEGQIGRGVNHTLIRVDQACNAHTNPNNFFLGVCQKIGEELFHQIQGGLGGLSGRGGGIQTVQDFSLFRHQCCGDGGATKVKTKG